MRIDIGPSQSGGLAIGLCLGLLVILIFVVIWIIAGMKAYGGQWYKLPGIGDVAWNTR